MPSRVLERTLPGTSQPHVGLEGASSLQRWRVDGQFANNVGAGQASASSDAMAIANACFIGTLLTDVSYWRNRGNDVGRLFGLAAFRRLGRRRSCSDCRACGSVYQTTFPCWQACVAVSSGQPCRACVVVFMRWCIAGTLGLRPCRGLAYPLWP